MNHNNQIISMEAVSLAAMLRSGELSATEVMQAYLERIHALNPSVNAICTLLPDDEALALARAADDARLRGEPIGALHGLPIACKDLANTRGMRTTFGSPAMADNIPDADQLVVERMRKAGALIIGKTNVPEFGAGSNTFNPLFGATRNPWNLDYCAGGSSGGAAAALAARMLPLADGSDMGGSLRNPAGFCNVLGMRPSMGRVPMSPCPMGWQSRLGIEGPMARTVDDLALLFSVQAGPDRRDPRSLLQPGEDLARIDPLDTRGVRIGFSEDLGFLPVEADVRRLFNDALDGLRRSGCEVEPACPDLTDAMDVFRTLRANFYATFCGPLLADHRSQMKQTLIENTELGFRLSAQDLSDADKKRTLIYQRMLGFFEHYDFLVLPTAQVMPFPHEQEWVESIDGTAMGDYLDWMTICCVITVTDLPVISVPCGFNSNGLPAGIQIVGPPWADRRVLEMAKAYTAEMDFSDRMPAL